jgi:probable phosphoglycerate mutase
MLKVPMNEIYLVRHGETEWNALGRFQGKLDSALTDAGAKQAEAIGKRLAELDVPVDAFLTSPLGRTRHTATIIAQCARLPAAQCDDRLAEVSLGSWDGLTHVDIDAQWPGLLDGSTPFDWFFRSPDGETYDAAIQRAKCWLDNRRGVTVAVSHGLIGRIIRGAYAGLAKVEALCLPVPQDVIWKLSDGHIEPVHVN